MTKTVIAFVKPEARRTNDVTTRQLMKYLLPDLNGQVLDLSDPEFARQLDALLSDEVAYAWGLDGTGARLQVDNRSIWETLKIPFISAHASAPFSLPANHRIPMPYVVNAYQYGDGLHLQQALIKSPQIATTVPVGIPPNALAASPWKTRPNRAVFLADGGDPAGQRRNWSAWPPRLRTVLHDCADTLASLAAGPVYPNVAATLAAHGLSLEGARPLMFGLLHELDTYARALRATTIAEALLPLPVDIVGEGWEHLQAREATARFHSAIDAALLEPLLAESRLVVAAAPNVGPGVPECVLNALAARCAVRCDQTSATGECLAGLSSFAEFDWTDPDLATYLAETVHRSLEPESEALDAAQAYVERLHAPRNVSHAFGELAEMVRLQEVMAPYALDAA